MWILKVSVENPICMLATTVIVLNLEDVFRGFGSRAHMVVRIMENEPEKRKMKRQLVSRRYRFFR